MEAYRAFVAAFDAELAPVGLLERAAAQTIADTHWRLNRIRTLENNLFANAFHEFSDQVSTDDPIIHSALAQAKALEVHAGVLTKLSLYEQRLTRTLEKAQAELLSLQEPRKWREHCNMQKTPPPRPQLENTKPASPHPAPGRAPEKTSSPASLAQPPLAQPPLAQPSLAQPPCVSMRADPPSSDAGQPAQNSKTAPGER
jgi:hypothetical protein